MSLLYHAVHSQPTEHDDLVVCWIPESDLVEPDTAGSSHAV